MATVKTITASLEKPIVYQPPSQQFAAFGIGQPQLCLEWQAGNLRVAVLMNQLEVVTAVILYDVTSRLGKDVTLDDRWDAAFTLRPGDSSRLVRSICGELHRIIGPGDPSFDDTLVFMQESGVPDALPLGPKEDREAVVFWGYYVRSRLMIWFPINTQRAIVGQWFVERWSVPDKEP